MFIRLFIFVSRYGMAPVLIVNCLNNMPIVMRQSDEADEMFIMPNQYNLKLWANPVGKRELIWSCGMSENQVYNLDTLQSKSSFAISPNKVGYTLSFLDGLQKVLMFVDDLANVSDEVVGFKEIEGQEYVLKLDSLSLSLIDDRNQIEILHVSVTSSSVNWGEKLTKKNSVFKAFPMHRIEKIEKAYKIYLADKPPTSPITASKSDYSLKREFSYKPILIGIYILFVL